MLQSSIRKPGTKLSPIVAVPTRREPMEVKPSKPTSAAKSTKLVPNKKFNSRNSTPSRSKFL
jgi:hypothetical protein